MFKYINSVIHSQQWIRFHSIAAIRNELATQFVNNSSSGRLSIFFLMELPQQS